MIDLRWRDRAACRSTPEPDQFFPQGRPTNKTKTLCSQCPVSGDCLQTALSLPEEPEGVWGNLPAADLRKRWRALHAS